LTFVLFFFVEILGVIFFGMLNSSRGVDMIFIFLAFMSIAEVTNNSAQTPASPTPNMYDLDKECRGFIDPNGNLGSWGQKLSNATQAINKDCFYNSNLFESICPKYQSFSFEKKQQFLSYFWASISQIAGSKYPATLNEGDNKEFVTGACNTLANVKIRKSKSDLVGLMLLPTNNTPKKPGKHCIYEKDPYDIHFQMYCSVSIFANDHCNSKNNHRFDFSHWESIRSGEAQKKARSFPGCEQN
jgi:hypothetical protein